MLWQGFNISKSRLMLYKKCKYSYFKTWVWAGLGQLWSPEKTPNMACLSSGAMFSNVHDSSVFSNLNSSHISKIDFKSTIFNGIVLSYWDNIIGPRLGHVWLESEEKLKEDTIKYVVSHTLDGELTRQAPKNAVDTKLFIIKERDVVLSSYIFSGLAKGAGEALYSLSLLLPFPALKKYLPFQELVDVRMKLLVAKLRVLQEKVGSFII